MKDETTTGESWSSSRGRGKGFLREKGKSPNRGRTYVPRGGISLRDTQTTYHGV